MKRKRRPREVKEAACQKSECKLTEELGREPNSPDSRPDPVSVPSTMWRSPDTVTHGTTPNWWHGHSMVSRVKYEMSKNLWLFADGRQRTMMTKRIMENSNLQMASSTHSSRQSYQKREKYNTFILIHYLNLLFTSPWHRTRITYSFNLYLLRAYYVLGIVLSAGIHSAGTEFLPL